MTKRMSCNVVKLDLLDLGLEIFRFDAGLVQHLSLVELEGHDCQGSHLLARANALNIR